MQRTAIFRVPLITAHPLGRKLADRNRILSTKASIRFRDIAAGAVKLWWPLVPFSPVIAGAAVEIRWPSVALVLPVLVIATVVATAAIRYWHRHAPDR